MIRAPRLRPGRASLLLASGVAAVLATQLATADATPPSSLPTLPAPQIATVADLPNFGEGVVFDRAGRLFVSDPSADRVLLVDTATGAAVPWASVQMPNGHKVLPDGTHVVLEQGAEGAAITQLDDDGRVLRRVTADDQGRPFRFPNDATVDQRTGGFYVTDPGPFMGGEPGRIFHVDRDWRVTTVSDGEVAFPNGIVLRPDGRSLLVAESLTNRVLTIDVGSPGVLQGAPRVFAQLPSQPNPWTLGEAEPDGMALDDRGNLYVAHFGAGVVRVLDTDGRLVGSLGSATSSVTNLAFGGPRGDELYVYGARGDSLEEFAEGGRIVRLTLPGITGLDLTP